MDQQGHYDVTVVRDKFQDKHGLYKLNQPNLPEISKIIFLLYRPVALHKDILALEPLWRLLDCRTMS